MLGYARTSTATSRKALILGIGTVGLLVASAAHAMLVAGVGPGPALMAAARDSSGMSVEVRAPAGGRSDMQVYGRLMRAQAASGGPELPARFPAVGFGSGVDKSVGVRWPGTWAIDHETVLSAPEARVEEGTLRATRFRLRVPDGSKLRVVVEGRKVVRESDASGVNRLVATGGTIRIVDDAGVTRMRAIAASDRDGATLTLTSTVETGEFTFDLSANDGAIPVSISFDTRTGVPDGERQPPHGAARWKLEAPKDAPGPCELRIQWSYDIEQLQLEGC